MTGAPASLFAILLLAGSPSAGPRPSLADHHAPASSAAREGSPLALAVVAGADAPQLLAQRAIERSWGVPEDSVYTVVDVPHWREEGLALSLSGAVPGVGQAYVGAWRAAAVFAVAEAASWISREAWRRRGHELQADASRYAGAPSDPASRWSASRWAGATGSDPSELLALYAADPRVFYDRIGNDPALLAGWSSDPAATRVPFQELRRHSEDRLRYARYATGALCLQHLVSGLDALRRARSHNAGISGGVKLRMGTRPSPGEPAFALALERSF